MAPTPSALGMFLPSWGIALAVTTIGIATIASLALHDANIDGPSSPFRRFLIRSFIAGTWAWIVVAGRVGFASLVGPTVLAIVLLPPLVLQVARHADPITRGAPVHAIASDFRTASWQGAWEVVGRGNPIPEVGLAGIVMRNDGETATAITYGANAVTPALWPWWSRPHGAISQHIDVTWTARIDQTGTYYIVIKLGRLTVQALGGGFLVTAPVPGGDVKGDFIKRNSLDGVATSWALSSTPAGSSVLIDGRPVWRGGSAGTVDRITFGDASSDREHAGSMAISSASITQRAFLGPP